MPWQPFKLNASKRVKGIQPERGWYCFDPETKVADLSERFEKKGIARKACRAKGARSDDPAAVIKPDGE